MRRGADLRRFFARIATTLALAGTANAQSFVEAANLVVGADPNFLLVADLDSDGTNDLAVSTANGNALTVLLADGSGGYETSTVGAGGDPQEVDAADLNADGALDLVTPNLFFANVAVLLGTGSGGFGPPVTYALGAGQFASPRGVDVADFNEDGRQDVVVSNTGSTCSLSLLMGNGLGELGVAGSVPVLPENCGLGPANPLEDVDSADFDGDGHLDLATCNSVWGTVAVLRGTGSGAFLPAIAHEVNPPWFVSPMAVVATDLNGDVKPDLVTANRKGNGTASVLLGDGTGGFPSVTQYGLGDFLDVAVGDLDGSGTPDLALASGDGDCVTILFGNGAGAFGDRLDLVTGDLAAGVAIGDIDGQRGSDLVVANRQADDVSVVLNVGSGAFHAAVSYRTTVVEPAESPFGVVVGDVDGDAHADVVTANWGTTTLSVFRGDGSGALGLPTVLDIGPPFGGGAYLVGIGLADMGGDGITDIVTSGVVTDEVQVIFGDGAGGFTEGAPVIVGDDPWFLAIGLVDDDPEQDVVTVNEDSDSVTVLLGDGLGGFRSVTDFAVGAQPRGLALLDLDGDGFTDVVTADTADHTVSVLRGNGSGAFGTAQAIPVGGGPQPYPIAVIAGDFNLDGIPDIASANYGAFTVSVLLGDGSSLTPAKDYVAGFQPQALAVADFDNDGDQDIAVDNYNFNEGLVSILPGNGMGGFAGPVAFRTGPGPLAMACGDLDADGRPDLVTANSSQNISVLLNDSAGGPAQWADLGGGKAGTYGVPKLLASGSLASDAVQGDDLNSLHLQAAPPTSPGVLAFGLTPLASPFKGGTMIPDPLLLLLFLTDGGGHVAVPYELPAGVPAGLDFYFQFWLADSGASMGLSASNGIHGVTS